MLPFAIVAPLIGLGLLVVQIALGGWTSANYAALACPTFPKCMGEWWPPMDLADGFVLWRGLGVNYEFGVLDTPASMMNCSWRGVRWPIMLSAVLTALNASIPGRPSTALSELTVMIEPLP